MSIANNLETICKNYRKELFEKFLEVGQGHPGSVFSNRNCNNFIS